MGLTFDSCDQIGIRKPKAAGLFNTDRLQNPLELMFKQAC